MSRVLYLVRDMTGTVQARMVAEKDDPPTLEPWMVQNIKFRGWSVDMWQAKETGVQIHGRVDWQKVAEKMAVVLRQLVAEEVSDEESAEKMMADAQEALDEFTLAELEVAVGAPDGVEDGGGDEGGDPVRT